jgi:TonB family protein
MIPIVTLAAWLLTLAVGIAGGLIAYPEPPQPAAKPLPPTQLVDVDVTHQPPPQKPEAPPSVAAPVPSLTAPPAIPAVAAPAAPPLAVAQPAPSLAFALPVEGFTRIVDADQAAHARPVQAGTGTSGSSSATSRPAPVAPASAAVSPPVTHLTLGEGEGNQPVPEYPREAVIARQQGNVGLRFTVDEAGRVTAVEVAAPSRFSLLNQAAVRTVKERWRFAPGKVRSYEVTIQFQLNE